MCIFTENDPLITLVDFENIFFHIREYNSPNIRLKHSIIHRMQIVVQNFNTKTIYISVRVFHARFEAEWDKETH